MKPPIFTIVCFQVLKLLLTTTFVWSLFSMGAGSTFAQTVVFSDDFSHSLSKWQPTRDDGQMWQIVDGGVEATVNQRATITELVPKDEFWKTDWKNITFSYDLTPLAGVDRNTSFGWESVKRWFEVHFVNGVLNLVRVEDGQVPLNIFDQYPMQNGQTYHVSITLQDQEITVKVDSQIVSQASYQDYVSQGGKIGLKAGTGSVYPTKLRYDNVEVIWLEPAATQLTVPMFKQIDPRWAEAVYDHGTSWSTQPTMSRWGCLVSSIAMVMNYHGLTKMVDGTTLTPAVLNSWLTQQPDGYIGEGLVNWSAVTRLTKQLSNHFGTPKLEYTRIAGKELTATINFIKSKRPSILEVSGHFLVGTGFTHNQQDLLINDPAYTFTKLSQHSSELRSTRLLTPSQTDLSYLLLAHLPELQVSLTSSSNEELPNLEKFTEMVTAAPDKESTHPLVVQQLAKPDSGEYQVVVQQAQPGPFSLTIYAYDQAANLTNLSLKGWVGPVPQAYTITYQKTGDTSQITPHFGWTQLRSVVVQLQQSGSFARKNIADQLTSLIDHAEQEPTAKQLQRIKQLEKIVTAFGKRLTPTTQSYLQHLLQLLATTITG